MCARAMANFGLSDLRLVAPRGGWPREPGDHEDTAEAAAAGAVARSWPTAKVYADRCRKRNRRPQLRLGDDGA